MTIAPRRRRTGEIPTWTWGASLLAFCVLLLAFPALDVAVKQGLIGRSAATAASFVVFAMCGITLTVSVPWACMRATGFDGNARTVPAVPLALGVAGFLGALVFRVLLDVGPVSAWPGWVVAAVSVTLWTVVVGVGVWIGHDHRLQDKRARRDAGRGDP